MSENVEVRLGQPGAKDERSAPVYVVRHGETEWNLQGRWQGRSDSPLTPLGRAQAEAMGRLLVELLAGETPTMVSSPLGRARTTAALIGEALGLGAADIPTDPLIAECDMGEWEGKTRADLDRSWPGLRKRRKIDKWHFTPAGGESHRDVARRAERWWQRLGVLEVPLVVVTHGIMSRVLRGHYLGLGPQETVRLVHHHGDVYRLTGNVAQVFSSDRAPTLHRG